MSFEVLSEGRYLRLCRRGQWEFCQRHAASGVVVIAAVTEAEELLLVEQYRPPVAAATIELPAGLAGDTQQFAGEAMVEAAKRELLEETGYRSQSLECVMSGPSSAGMSDEIIHFFIALDVEWEHEGGGDASEDITVHRVPIMEIDKWLNDCLASQRLVDPKVWTGLYWLRRELEQQSQRQSKQQKAAE